MIAFLTLRSASQDNIRLWNVNENLEQRPRALGFKIIAGHHGGVVSQIREITEPASFALLTIAVIDPTCKFMVTASGDRGWHGESTRTVLVHELKPIL